MAYPESDLCVRWPNLADARFGAEILFCTDDFFAAAERMLCHTQAQWKEGVFDDSGKWMDGWESRRKRCEGFDCSIIRLGLPGVLKGIDLDTSHFTGNFPPSASLEACYCESGDPTSDTRWTEILPSVALSGDAHHIHGIDDERCWTHLKLNIYPDGGIARLRAWGRPRTPIEAGSQTPIDLAVVNGGAPWPAATSILAAWPISSIRAAASTWAMAASAGCALLACRSTSHTRSANR
ncbi:hypothetical protein [Marinobacterium rhizophilum]|uniref:hypothetical protein n=1 Tax=Marinobacterium rhizophilum TaxID=420402 RepID=UPI0021042F76|nr:hypothetical protein [Marinobacterium rhizophilum]